MYFLFLSLSYTHVYTHIQSHTQTHTPLEGLSEVSQVSLQKLKNHLGTFTTSNMLTFFFLEEVKVYINANAKSSL